MRALHKIKVTSKYSLALNILCTVMAKRLLTSDDKSLMCALRLEKGWGGSLRMIREFPQRQWKRSTLNNLIKKIDETGDTNRKQDFSRMERLLIVHEKQLLFSLLTFQPLL